MLFLWVQNIVKKGRSLDESNGRAHIQNSAMVCIQRKETSRSFLTNMDNNHHQSPLLTTKHHFWHLPLHLRSILAILRWILRSQVVEAGSSSVAILRGGQTWATFWSKMAMENLSCIDYWLVVWNMFYFSNIGNNNPNWLLYFSEG
jgi:hypothetical protein